MEDVRMMRDNDSTPHPTENLATPLTPNRRELDAEYPALPSLLPFTTNSQHADKDRFSSRPKPQRSKPLSKGFEKPSFSHIAILTVLCLITYPAFYILTLVAKDKSLFVVRLIVSLWCSGVGLALGYILLRIGAQHIEAASEFTPIGCRDIF